MNIYSSERMRWMRPAISTLGLSLILSSCAAEGDHFGKSAIRNIRATICDWHTEATDYPDQVALVTLDDGTILGIADPNNEQHSFHVIASEHTDMQSHPDAVLKTIFKASFYTDQFDLKLIDNQIAEATPVGHIKKCDEVSYLG